MKRFTLLFGLVLVVLSTSKAVAAVPQLINFQGKLTTPSGDTVAPGSYNVTFRIWDAASGGTELWNSGVQAVNVAGGLFNTLLAAPEGVFNGEQRWLGITVAPDINELTPRTQIVSVGFSYRVGSVDGASGGTITSKVSIGPGHTNTGQSAFVAGASNTVTGDFATVGGGGINNAGDIYATVGGGILNTASGPRAAVGGGEQNTASGSDATVGGGGNNTASGSSATVSGGYSNTASTTYATVGGGFGNIADDTATAVAGGANNRARGRYSVVAGGGSTDPADSNAASGYWSAIGGGTRNTASGNYATVGGGAVNVASGVEAKVGGGEGNTASGNSATVGGGVVNIASNHKATVGGGSGNTASGENATVGGGSGNTASGLFAAVGGGESNTASNFAATVGGGNNNIASFPNATVSGGAGNTASGIYATVGGGSANIASANFATVGGGYSDTASGIWSTVPGGYGNKAAGDYSFSAGQRAKAVHQGAFVWADASTSDFASSAVDEFNVRASGGTRIFSNSALSAGVTLAAGASAWVAVSDSNLKRNIRTLDGRQMLEKVVQLPIKRWSYKAQDPTIEHIGPMAQDFYPLFQVGDDEKTISTIDPPGIALAAIQGLYQIVEEQKAENDEMRKELKDLRELVQKLLAEQETKPAQVLTTTR